MRDFNYYRPAKVADAVKLIKKATNGKLMSGGMTLIPTMKQGLAAPSDIVDLTGLGIPVFRSVAARSPSWGEPSTAKSPRARS